MSTVEELQALIEAEKQNHKKQMTELRREAAALQSVLADQQTAFTDLLSRVTDLRVAKGEFLASQAARGTTVKHFQTGCELADEVLMKLQQKLREPTGSGGSLLDKLVAAAKEGIIVSARGQPVRLGPDASRTSIALATRPDIRGVRKWAREHWAECPRCAAAAAKVPRNEPYTYQNKHTGLRAAPDLRSVPGKRHHRVLFRIHQDRSLEARSEEETIEIVRSIVLLRVRSSQGQPLEDAKAMSATVADVVNRTVKKALEATQTRVRSSAPWNQPATANTDLSVAVDLLLHSIVPTVRVKAVANPYVAQDRCSILQVEVRLCTPIQISVLTPLLAVMQRAEQRAYMAQHLWTPLAQTVGGLFGVQDVLHDYTAVAVRFVDGLFELFLQAEKLRKGQPHQGDVMEKLCVFVHALALYNTSVELELAVPHVIEELRSTGAAKRSGLRLARAFLRNLTSPSPLHVPPSTDPEAVDLSVKITQAPTAVLELLNNTFSSNERLPSTSRNSILDLVVTPKIKISMALKLYSELFIEIYRPFSRQSGVIIASENAAGGKPRAPACMPVIDLPVDTVAANVSLSAATDKWVEALKQKEQHAGEASALETKGKELAEKLLHDAEQNALVDSVKKELEGLHIKLVGVATTHVDVALPFGLSLMEAKDVSRPLFYVHVEAT